MENNDIPTLSAEDIANLRAEGKELDFVIQETEDGVDIYLTRDNDICGRIAELLDPSGESLFQQFLDSAPKSIDGENHQHFCG